jgi:hypothetical protein
MQGGGAAQPVAINRDTCDHRALFDRLNSIAQSNSIARP